LAFRIIKIIARTPGKRGALVFAAGLALVTGLYRGIEKNSVADMLAGHDRLKKLVDSPRMKLGLSSSLGPRASRLLMPMSERDARGPGEHEYLSLVSDASCSAATARKTRHWSVARRRVAFSGQKPTTSQRG